jgi:hypothetical protein
VTADDFRTIALSLDGVVEQSHMNHPDFRANGRIFATLRADDTLAMVKLTPAEQRELLRKHPKAFEPSPGAWGRQGCTDVRLSAADRATVRAAIVLAWEGAVARPRAKPKAKPRTRPARRSPR